MSLLKSPEWVRSFRLASVLLAASVLGACGGGPALSTGPVPGDDPQFSVERFLTAVNARNLDEMARIFGTADGPIIETGGSVGCGFRGVGSAFGLGDGCISSQEVELRMDAIGEILRHSSFEVISERRVAGREDPTLRFGVTLVIGERTIPDVSFVTVQAGSGEWFLEEIDLPKVTGG